jgi:hypothetical protein
MIKLRLPAARTAAALAVVGMLTLSAAGCAGQVSSTAPADAQSHEPIGPEPELRAPGAPQIHLRWRSCAGEPSMDRTVEPRSGFALLSHLDTFRPVAAVSCAEEQQRRPDGGLDGVAVEDRADEVAALSAALRLPDQFYEPGPSEQSVAVEEAPGHMCTLDGYAEPRLVLLDAQGRWVRPGIPRNDCGKPRAEVDAAMDKLRWTRVATRVLHEIESAEAAASGCSQVSTDMVWFTGLFPPSRQADPGPLPDDAAAVRLCLYRVPASEQGSEKPQGGFVSGGSLPAGRWAAVKREIQASRPATPCTTPTDRFAMLATPQGDIYVELDGCRRLLAWGVLPGDETSFEVLRQASAALPALLTKP